MRDGWERQTVMIANKLKFAGFNPDMSEEVLGHPKMSCAGDAGLGRRRRRSPAKMLVKAATALRSAIRRK
jgi:hypothetical protein